MFTPLETALGALLLHHASSALLFNNGCVLGASGFLRGFLTSSASWNNKLFLLGMVGSYVIVRYFLPDLIPHHHHPPFRWEWYSALFVVATGVLTGWGTKACKGCTSGHMLCGVPRMSGRSILATAIFFLTALLAFNLAQPYLGDAIRTCSAEEPCYTPAFPEPKLAVELVVVTLGTVASSKVAEHIMVQRTEPRTARSMMFFLAGTCFGLGLLLSGMASPAKVLGFFAVRPLHNWDPSLAMIVLFGLVPNLVVNRIKGFKEPPRFSGDYSLPRKTLNDVDWRFVAGAAAFGVAWGLTGICPGPAVLRAVAQPLWGALWMGGFWVGSLA